MSWKGWWVVFLQITPGIGSICSLFSGHWICRAMDGPNVPVFKNGTIPRGFTRCSPPCHGNFCPVFCADKHSCGRTFVRVDAQMTLVLFGICHGCFSSRIRLSVSWSRCKTYEMYQFLVTNWKLCVRAKKYSNGQSTGGRSLVWSWTPLIQKFLGRHLLALIWGFLVQPTWSKLRLACPTRETS